MVKMNSMRGTVHADGRDWINFEAALARFGLAREQLHFIVSQYPLPRRRMPTEGPKESAGPEDYYDAQELETAVKQYKQERGLEQ